MSAENRRDAKEKQHPTPGEATSSPWVNCSQEQEVADGYCFADLASLPDDFYRSLTARLARIAEKIGVPRDLCEDVAQEALLEAVAKREQFQGEHAVRRFCLWLIHHVVPHRAADLFRRRDREWAQSLDTPSAETMDRKEAKRAVCTEESECLDALLARLRREEPENCWLLCEHRLQGRSIQELADESGWTANEIRCRIYRAMGKLRQWASTPRFHGEIEP